jgi:hypothetical protein
MPCVLIQQMHASRPANSAPSAGNGKYQINDINKYAEIGHLTHKIVHLSTQSVN